ncbi:hypothetical protein ACOME3_007756 [Neoechinorhynchus agilis]
MVDIMAMLKACRIVHCDLKPENFIVLNQGRRLKLIDFAYAFEMPPNQGTLLRHPSGTREYMAPEQVPKQDPTLKGYFHPVLLSYQTDIYGLGAVLYEMTFGDPPWTYKHPRVSIPHNRDLQLRGLVIWMLTPDSKSRPTITQVMFHPYLSHLLPSKPFPS